MTRTLFAPRDFSKKPLTVTGIIRITGEAVDGLTIHNGQDVRDFLTGGHRETTGYWTPSGWSELICSECGDTSKWCPDLSRELPA